MVNRAAKALAAFNGSNEVEIPDIAMVVTLCLRHRLRKDPLETMDSGEIVAETFEKVFEYDIGDNKTEIDNYRDFIVSIKERTHNSNPTLTNTFSSGQVFQTGMK